MTNQITTTHLGVLTFQQDDVLHFPFGLPAFLAEVRFVVVQDPRSPLLCYLQSISTPDLRFIMIPVPAVDPEYNLALSEPDKDVLFPCREPFRRNELAVYFIVSVPPDGAPTMNKLAPVVVRAPAGRGVQAVRSDLVYSHAAPLTPARSRIGEETPCSS